METPEYLKKQLEEIDAKISAAQELKNDPGVAELAVEEINSLLEQKELLLNSFLPKEKAESDQGFNNIIMEFRSAAGGDEAKIWAGELMRMYTRFAQTKGWEVSNLDDLSIKIKGKDSYRSLKYEAGVHRVQRVPVTEAQGRIHTSTASVAVLPIIPESTIEIKPDDLEITFTHSSGHGGQNVNKVSTAVRLVHRPSGIIVESQTQRFQEQNRKIAMDILRSKLWEIEEEKRLEKINAARSAIGRGNRSEKIRTYNFPQDRVTDHRIKKSWHNLPAILDGQIDEILKETSKSLEN